MGRVDPTSSLSSSSSPHSSAPGSLDRGGIYDGLSFESNIILFPLVQDTQVRFRLRNYIGLTRYVVQACCIRQLGLVCSCLLSLYLSASRVDANFVSFSISGTKFGSSRPPPRHPPAPLLSTSSPVDCDGRGGSHVFIIIIIISAFLSSR